MQSPRPPFRPEYLPQHPSLKKLSQLVPPSVRQTKFHAHTKQEIYYLNTF